MRAADDFAAIRARAFELADDQAKLRMCRRAQGQSAEGCWCIKPDGGVYQCPPGWDSARDAARAAE
jgi:hypothetical protein